MATSRRLHRNPYLPVLFVVHLHKRKIKMLNLKITTAAVVVTMLASAPLALAQTTLGGNASDNSASGGRENGTTEGAGKGGMTKSGSGAMMKSDGMTKGSMSNGTNAPATNQMNKGSDPMANGK